MTVRSDARRRFLAAFAALVAAGALGAAGVRVSAAPQGRGRGARIDDIARKWLDLSYASLSPAQKLDIYLPETGDGPFPVIVHIHGGAFLGGDKRDPQVQPVLGVLGHGYAVASINYRLSGEAIFPAQIQDVKAAIRWLRANARRYRLNPDKVAAWGASAGGHLAALAGTSGGVEALEDRALGSPLQSSGVQAVVDWFGPINFLAMDRQFRASGIGRADHDAPDSPESRLLGKPITEAPGLVRDASPATYITPDDPPFLIQHGTRDPLVPTEQSVLFAQDLRKALGPGKVMLDLIEGAGHGGREFSSPENLKKVIGFLDRTLK
jgi:acetyl esterase/lipase